ncbi:uncharacterized protein PHALS_06889 [Plasmopara halstedii]|uniref:Uncharacterized protein n=1 Tax=Plasmopara halstedii TaxID=4781 RepID=A0A0P1B543_PLAHL|nr:uncharacterized protein PHALS_06889 [Plasmopara halstedii]CEG49105.1 hypothetical protein PHALS_06889 [Plasmopara halstedii]|eukprot:XP_024585474.1 hypothetical protein PHALS_06889 [Plasmopara halstedii]
MIPRSYSSDGARKWLFFAREETDLLVFTAVVSLEINVIAQLRVDKDALKEHSDELGLEMEPEAFKKLLLKALEQRSCVSVETELDNGILKEVFLSLTYKFSSSISRKGLFRLQIVAKEIPQSLLELLTSIHVNPPQPMLSEQQKIEHERVKALDISKKEEIDPASVTRNSQDTKDISIASQSSRNESTTKVNPMVLKRRHIPTGTMRRRGSKGAKLAKK